MKFKSESANLVVWDAEKSKALCTFKNGEYETDDPYVIEKLKGKYEVIDNGRQAEQRNTEGQEDKGQQIVTTGEKDGWAVNESVEKLRQEAKEKGIKNWHNMKPENLVKKLRG